MVKTIFEGYEGLDFQVFELIQLNDFVSHQIAHNTIFVTIENKLLDYVSDTLWNAYPGKVLFKPKVDQYYRYRQDDEIVVGRLFSYVHVHIRVYVQDLLMRRLREGSP